MKNKKWTQEEDNILILGLAQGKIYKDIEVPDRTTKAVISRISYLISIGKLPSASIKAKKWDAEEDKLLIELKNEGKSNKEISGILGRTTESVKGRLKKVWATNSTSGNFNWTDEEIEVLKLNMDTTYEELAQRMGRSVESVANKARRLGLCRVFHGSYSDSELLDTVRKYRSRDALKYSGERITPKMVEHRFGGWSSALKLAGLDPNDSSLVPNKETTLYLVDFGEFKKVGITQRSIEERFKGEPEYIVLDSVGFSCLEEALETEREILRNMREFRVSGDIRRGASECFKFTCTLLEEII